MLLTIKELVLVSAKRKKSVQTKAHKPSQPDHHLSTTVKPTVLYYNSLKSVFWTHLKVMILVALSICVLLENEQKAGYSGGVAYPVAANSSRVVPLSLGSTSRSSAEHGLSSLPSLEMVRKDVGDTDWERLLSLLPRSAPPGVCVSVLRVLLLLWARGGGARWPSGMSWGCYKNVLNVCVLVTDFEIPLERHPRFNLPLQLLKTQKSETLSLSGLTIEGEASVLAVGTAIPVSSPAPPAAGHRVAEEGLWTHSGLAHEWSVLAEGWNNTELLITC